MEVTEKEFFSHIGKRDIVTSCDYKQGDSEIVSLFKTRHQTVIGKIVSDGNSNRTFFLGAN